MDTFTQHFLEHFHPKFESEIEENEVLEKRETSNDAPLIFTQPFNLFIFYQFVLVSCKCV